MFAHAEDLNVLDNDHFVMSFVEDGIIDNIFHVLLVAFGEEEHSFRIARRSVQDTLSVWVFAYAFEDGPHCLSHLF